MRTAQIFYTLLILLSFAALFTGKVSLDNVKLFFQLTYDQNED